MVPSFAGNAKHFRVFAMDAKIIDLRCLPVHFSGLDSGTVLPSVGYDSPCHVFFGRDPSQAVLDVVRQPHDLSDQL